MGAKSMLDLSFNIARCLLLQATAFADTYFNDRIVALDAAGVLLGGKMGVLWVTEH